MSQELLLVDFPNSPVTLNEPAKVLVNSNKGGSKTYEIPTGVTAVELVALAKEMFFREFPKLDENDYRVAGEGARVLSNVEARGYQYGLTEDDGS